MFGLMKARACGLPRAEKARRRLHYCGTCKTMGTMFGQRSRLLLNFDSVFASEVLTSIAPDEGAVEQWARPYQALNCFSLPKKGDLPPVLRFTAAMTVVMAEVKVADHIVDSRALPWKIARRVLSRSFREAAKELDELGFRTEELWRVVRTQDRCESDLASLAGLADPDAVLDRASEATAEATALAFAHGSRLCGKPETLEPLDALGRAFGELVYLLDALADFDADLRKGEFNAVAVAFGITRGPMPPAARGRVERRLRDLQSRAGAALEQLPMAPERRRIFAGRLGDNLRRAIGPKLPVLAASRDHGPSCAPLTIADRWRAGVKLGHSIAREHSANCTSPFTGFARAPFVFGLAAAAGFLFPARTASATSLGECFDVGLHLPAIGGALASLAIAPMRMSGRPPGPDELPSMRNWPDSQATQQALEEEQRRRGQQPGGGGDSGNDGGCCDCCCECGDCGDGSCDCCGSCDCGSCCSSCNCCGDCGCSNSCCDCNCDGCCDCGGCDCGN